MLDFRIDTFLAVCKTMNYTKAADRLGITQPAVSQHIRSLEEQFGVRLFAFKGKKISLTNAGQLLCTTATTMKHDALFLEERLARIEKQEHRLTFGATLTIGEYVMPPLLARYAEQHTHTMFRMTVANTQELLRRLDDGDIDFAFVEGFFDKTEYDYLTYSKERYIAVCAPSYRLSEPVRSLEDLLQETLLVREAGSGTREILEQALSFRNLSLCDFRQLTEISSIGAIKELAARGMGITLLYETAVQKELKNGGLREIPLEEDITHDFTFLWRKNSLFADAYHALFQEWHPGLAE